MSNAARQWSLVRVAVAAAALAGCGSSKPIEFADGHVGDGQDIADAAVAETDDAGRDVAVPEDGDTAAEASANDASKDTAGETAEDTGGSEGGGGICGNHAGYLPILGVDTIGPSGGASYDGPAIVERSTKTELVIAFSPAAMAAPQDGGAGTPPPMHAVLNANAPMPGFPLGARVWLYKSTAGNPPSAPFSGPQPWTIAVRDSEGGHLIIGAGKEPDGTALIPFGLSTAATCTSPYSDHCVNGSAVYSSLDVHGDMDVTIADAETRTVRVGGLDYDVMVMARDIAGTRNQCADYSPYDGVAMDVRAKDPSALIAALPAGVPIACARGNDIIEEVGHSFYGVSTTTSYDGKAFYTKRGTPRPSSECFQFSVVGVTAAVPTVTPTIEFCAPIGRFPEPAVGQEFWATLSSFDIIALRDPNRGPLLLASVYAAAPFDASTSARIAEVLGVPVEARAACAYAPSHDPNDAKPLSLWEVAVGATAPGIIKTDGHSVVAIAGKNYDAWMSASASQLSFSLVAK